MTNTKIVGNAFFTPLKDEEVSEKYGKIIGIYRREADRQRIGAEEPLCYRVAAGFSLCDAHKIGPSRRYTDLGDEVTEEKLAFWLPRPVSGSQPMSARTQLMMLADLRQHLGLPEGHLSGFGRASLLAGLIMTHYAVTDKNVLHSDFGCCRTDTPGRTEGGSGLNVYFGRGENRDLPALSIGAYDDGRPYMVQRMPPKCVFALGLEDT